MSYFKNLLKKSGEYLNTYADDKEAQYYGDQVPSEPKVIQGNVVMPELKGQTQDDLLAMTQAFEGVGMKGGLNVERIGELFDKQLSEFDSIAVTAKNLLQQAKENNKDLFNKQRRSMGDNSGISVEEAVQLASEAGFDNIARRFLKRKPGELLRPEQVGGGLVVLYRLVKEMAYGAEKALAIDPSNVDELENAMMKVEALGQLYTYMSASIGGTVSEYGRGLSYVSHLDKFLKIDKDSVNRKMDEFLKSYSPLRDSDPETRVKNIRFHMKNLVALDFADRAKYTDLISRTLNRSRNIFMESYMNAMLSSPVTHTVNIAGNLAFQASRFLETGIASMIGKTRQTVMELSGVKMDPADRVYATEAMAFIHGSLYAQKDAFTLAGKAFIKGRSGDLMSKLDIDEDRIGIGNTRDISKILTQASEGNWGSFFLNTMGVINTISSRFLAVEDEYFKVMIKRRVQYQEAFKASLLEIQKRVEAGFPLKRTPDMKKPEYNEAGELIAGELSAEEYGAKVAESVLTDPSAEVVKRMEADALTETFQSPVQGNKIANGANFLINNDVVKVLGVPFFKTPTNIFKQTYDRSLNIFTAPKALIDGKGREFDEALAKMVMGWGTAGTMLALAHGYYGDDVIITGTGPVSGYQFKDVVNKGANVPPSSIGFKMEDGSYKFVSFARFDPLSMLLTASADVSNFLSYSDDASAGEALVQAFTLAVSEYSTSIPFMQGLADIGTLLADRHNTGEKKLERLTRFLATRLTDASLSASSNLGGIGYYFSEEGGNYPFVGSSSFHATLERISKPEASLTMITDEQLANFGTDRLEDVPVALRAVYEVINKHYARNALFSDKTYASVNFWNEPIRQVSRENLEDLDVGFTNLGFTVPGDKIALFNPIKIQTGEFKPLDEELIRLAVGGYGKFSNHKRKMRGYMLTAEDYLDFVGYANNIDSEGRLPGDANYKVKERLLPSLTSAINSKEYLKLDNENKFLYLKDILDDRRAEAREKLFSSGRLGTLFARDNPDVQ